MNPEEVIDSGRLDWIWSEELHDQGYISADRNTLARVLSRPCPHCHVESGVWCRNTGTGEPLEHLDQQHVSRRDLSGFA